MILKYGKRFRFAPSFNQYFLPIKKAKQQIPASESVRAVEFLTFPEQIFSPVSSWVHTATYIP